ncbi:S-layer homology domain-containing protein [Paenibacillus amylolyticus]|uniref:S-layer homology domain-containing protein n=1 Tax=Paenibacillus amylolyticus TaxID=1451 RepID=UPI00249C4C62|nr:S-layer homology domain-containing protein [Paenibacillus amylolyticus]WFA84688.1 S-layer homology domain-containing protein [Paenibacillus amylolyticus]
MRNTSDPIKKENSNVMNAQGGEKKVMKKILSVALSTAMAFSMFASVAFGDTAVSPQQQFDALKAKGIFNGYPDGTAGLDKDMTRAEFAKVITKLLGLKEITGTLSYTDKNYTAKNWAVPYIEAVTAAGIMEGKNVEKKIFDFNGKVTVSEMATILTRALDLEIPAETNNTAPAWAKGYVQAAINAGLVDANTNFTANASRELLVGAAYAIDEAQSLKVSSYTVTEGGKVVEFKISDGETVKVTLDKALEANKETEVKFTYKEKSFTEKVTYVVEAATKVQSASSVNLKEVDVAFDGKVDKATATDKANYTVDSNAKGIKSITLLADGKTARLLLNESSKFTQGTTYKVAVKNVKSSTGTVLPQGEVSFTSADNVLPTVTEVKALGTKVIKVTFSEPVVAPASSNFQLDDKAFVGSVTPGANQREVILRDYTGTISEGAHKLTTSMIEDFAGLKSLAATTDFTVAADTEGPKVTEISATLEKVTVTFDEEIDPASVTNDSFYWKNGDSKKTGTVTQIASNVYEVEFTQANRLPGYESTLFVEVKDYSGNVNAVKEHKINATVDLVRPQVVETTFGNRTNELTVRFDKAVDAADKKYFTVKKGNDVIPVSSVSALDTSNKVFQVKFFSTLATGTYNLKVADVQDTTALRNTLVEYNGTFVANDTANPEITSTDYNEAARKVTLNFGREMDLSTLNLKSNYYISFAKAGNNVQNIAVPNETAVNVVNGGKSVVLTLPETIDGTRVTFGPTGSVSSVWATGLKSKTGQAVAISAKGLNNATDNQLKWTNSVQKDARTFELTFNNVVANASAGDFQISGVYPTSVSIDEKTVTLKTDRDFTGANIVIFANNSIETYSTGKLNLSGNISMPVNTAVAPRVVSVTGTATGSGAAREIDQKIKVKFTSDVTTALTTGNLNQLGNDFIVRDLSLTNPSTKSLANVTDYTVTLDQNDSKAVIIEILNENAQENPVSVEVSNNAKYLTAVGGTNAPVVAKSDAYTVAAPSSSVNNPVVASTAVKAPKDAVSATADKAGIKLTAINKGIAGNSIPVVTLQAAAPTVTDNTVTVTAPNGTVANYVIEYGAAADADAIIAQINKEALPFNASKGTAATLGAATFTFANGADKVPGELKITLDKVVTLVGNQVKIGNDNLTAATSTVNGVTVITVEIGDKAVSGEQLSLTASYGGKDVVISGVTISNNTY